MKRRIKPISFSYALCYKYDLTDSTTDSCFIGPFDTHDQAYLHLFIYGPLGADIVTHNGDCDLSETEHIDIVNMA